MAIAKVKLTVVRRDCPDIEVQLGFFPTKEAALPEFKEVIARDDTLRAIIDTVVVSAPRTISLAMTLGRSLSKVRMT